MPRRNPYYSRKQEKHDEAVGCLVAGLILIPLILIVATILTLTR